ncbi:MAG: hypothetical protein PWR30_196 [Candidatus Woesearchaeota archaeon]|nr:hypothetical protein [Candidatus Woesearchaeota archaeon]
MDILDEYAKKVFEIKNSLSEEDLKKHIGVKELKKYVTIDTILSNIMQKINQYERSLRTEKNAYLASLTIGETLSYLIKDMIYDEKEIPKGILELYNENTKYLTSFREKIHENRIKEAKKLIEQKEFDNAIDLLYDDIRELKRNPLYLKIIPKKEGIELLKEAALRMSEFNYESNKDYDFFLSKAEEWQKEDF